MGLTSNRNQFAGAARRCHAHEAREPIERVILYLKDFPAAGVPLRSSRMHSVHGLASGMTANGMDVEVWCEGRRTLHTVAPEGYSVHCFESAPHRALRRSLTVSPALMKRLRALDAERDLVVLNGMFELNIYALSRKLKSLNVPYVVAPHGSYSPSAFAQRSHFAWLYWYLLERRMLANAYAVQQVDSRHERWTRKLGIAAPVIAAEHGFFSRDVLTPQDLIWRNHGVPRALYSGTLSIHEEGLDVLLGGFDRAAQKQRLNLIVQSNDTRDSAQSLYAVISTLPNASGVAVVHSTFDVPTPRAMLAYDIVCIPARAERFGVSAVPAMLAGRVLLVSATSGIAPHVERAGCGIVVSPTAADIRHGFEYLLAHRKQWREMGLRGRRYALAHLTWRSIARRTLLHYHRVASP